MMPRIKKYYLLEDYSNFSQGDVVEYMQIGGFIIIRIDGVNVATDFNTKIFNVTFGGNNNLPTPLEFLSNVKLGTLEELRQQKLKDLI
jgi:hypothetical protein